MNMFASDADTSVTYRDAVIRIRHYHAEHPTAEGSNYEQGEFSGLVKALWLIYGNEGTDELDTLMDVVRDYVPLS